MSKTHSTKAVQWILMGIPILFLLGTPLHFLYEWTGKITAVGVFVPINESVWEHLKLTFWPQVIWFMGLYFWKRKAWELDGNRWFVAAATAILICPLVILTFFYTYTGAFGIESLLLDIFSMFLGLTLGHYAAAHMYTYSKPGVWCKRTSLLVIFLFAVVFTICTFAPPHLPVFKDGSTGTYGIQK